MRMPVHSRRVLSSARRGSSSVGRALASQAGGRGFETRLPLNAKALLSKPRMNPGLFCFQWLMRRVNCRLVQNDVDCWFFAF